MTVEVDDRIVTSNHKVSQISPLVLTPKVSAKVLIPVEDKETETEAVSRKSSSGSPEMYLVLEAMLLIMMMKMMNSKTLTFQNPSAQLYSAMAQLSPLTQYTESYVDSSHPSIQQAISVDVVAYLLKNDILTLEELVREMGMYLPTTDNLIRARD
ncbi:hypothetical protein VitviT2T_018340 [Vitis vinifera]|uniref:Uncharacterized protein n=1 Tax=Vitis vinifera TaxID=29760 RepID=A0ABY9D081_VITVI|nr:hypothetical protein VitviT2T_018340 [Vitis vinifera]